MLVCFPYSLVDQALAAKLATWIRELGRNEGHSCLIVRDVRCDEHPSIEQDLGSVFDKVETIRYSEQIDGWPQGANLMFQAAARYIEHKYRTPFLWLEADCLPLKSGWVAEISAEHKKGGKPFTGFKVQVPNVPIHMSGIGCYPWDLCNHAGTIYQATEIAWDVHAAPQIVPRMHPTSLIAHRWKYPPFKNQSEVDNLLGQIGNAVIFHSDKSGTLLDFLRERRAPQQNPVQVNLERSSPVTDILIKTYSKDLPWLAWCLRSINKFTSGFRKTIIISPDDDMGSTDKMGYDWQQRFEYGMGNSNQDFYLSQQVFKMYADTFTDANFILHIDSDTIFTCTVTPETYFRDGKPVIMMTPIDQAHPDEQQAWRKVMNKFMGKPSQFEFMRRFPFVYPRWAYGSLREFCLQRHGITLDKYIMSQPYREFSEFNCMGFYLWENHRDKFSWVDTSNVPEKDWPELTVDQRFSHNPIPTEEWDKILGGSEVIADRNKNPSTGDETLSPKALPVCSLPQTPTVTRRKPNRKTLGSEDNKRSEQISPNGTPDPSLPNIFSEDQLAKIKTTEDLIIFGKSDDFIKQLSKYFTDPLSKGRIIKKLKSYPIIK